MKKLLLIAGHGDGDVGACSDYGVEFRETRRLVNQVKVDFAPYDVQVDVYPQDRNAYKDIKNGRPALDFKKYEYIFEIHFNSSTSSSSNGVECWVVPEEKGVTVEAGVVANITRLGFKNRGVKFEEFCVINYAKRCGVSAALLETCFINNKGDMDRYNLNFNSVSKAIVNGIVNGFGVSVKVAPSVPSSPIKVGDMVIVNSSASKYATGQAISGWVKNSKFGVKQVSGDKILLEKINSWVFIKDVKRL